MIIPSRSGSVGLVVLLLAISSFILFTIHSPASSRRDWPTSSNVDHDDTTEMSELDGQPKSRNAFCVFLAEPNAAIADHKEDYYFMGTRMLLYQLLHDPETKSNPPIPFVVLVTEKVPEWKRAQLIREGAQVKVISHIDVPWIKPGRPRWEHVMDKLHMFELIEFDKVLLFDTDTVVIRSLDGIFDDPAAMELDNRNQPDNVMPDEAPQPSKYLMAGNGNSPVNHTYPTPRGGKLNAGFVLFKPSMEMFDYYMSLTKIEGRFNGHSPEQDLWNYAHRAKGNMPWKQLNGDWTINNPNMDDIQHGIAALHEKYWRVREPELRAVLQRSRWRMNGFFDGYSATVQ